MSIGTLRKAIDELVAEGIMIRHQGRGTFVATHRQEDHFFRFFRIVRQDGHREYPTVRLARFRRAKADKDEVAALGLAVGEPVFRFANVLSLEGTPMILSEDGSVLGGYVSPDELQAALEELDAGQAPVASTATGGM